MRGAWSGSLPQKTPQLATRVGRGHPFLGENWGVCVPGPCREQIIRLQGQVDKHYAGLKEAAEERRRRLENMSHLFQLKREVEDLEQWIAERDVVASSQEMGQDLDHVTVRVPGQARRCQHVVLGGVNLTLPSSTQLLREKFREFARETGSVGQERVDRVNLAIEDLIDAGHAEAATMAEWKDGLNESWADLLELIDTRMQLLAASHDLHKYFYDGAELLALIASRRQELPQDLGEDAGTVEAFHRMHSAFERDLQLLEAQVRLRPGPAGMPRSAAAGTQHPLRSPALPGRCSSFGRRRHACRPPTPGRRRPASRSKSRRWHEPCGRCWRHAAGAGPGWWTRPTSIASSAWHGTCSPGWRAPSGRSRRRRNPGMAVPRGQPEPFAGTRH